ncbi:MAG: TerB family tellurite resistance protein, partial [Pseudomonadota bacterium]
MANDEFNRNQPPSLPSESLLDQMRNLQAKGKSQKNVDIPLATAIVLLEVASSDHMVDRFEKSVIHNGLKSIFKISDQKAQALLAQAKTAMSSMRSSSAEASMLKEMLDPASKRAVAALIDSLIRCNGVVDTMEVYLR